MMVEEMRSLKRTNEWDGCSILQVATLLDLGYSKSEVRDLLEAANMLNCHPDWSESTLEEIRQHFTALYKDLTGESK